MLKKIILVFAILFAVCIFVFVASINIYMCVYALLATLIIMLIAINVYRKCKEEEFIENHRIISRGMNEREVITILGDGYTKSYLKNGIDVYKWYYRKNGISFRIAWRVYEHESSYVRSICVHFKDGYVVEVIANNMD